MSKEIDLIAGLPRLQPVPLAAIQCIVDKCVEEASESGKDLDREVTILQDWLASRLRWDDVYDRQARDLVEATRRASDLERILMILLTPADFETIRHWLGWSEERVSAALIEAQRAGLVVQEAFVLTEEGKRMEVERRARRG